MAVFGFARHLVLPPSRDYPSGRTIHNKFIILEGTELHGESRNPDAVFKRYCDRAGVSAQSFYQLFAVPNIRVPDGEEDEHHTPVSQGSSDAEDAAPAADAEDSD